MYMVGQKSGAHDHNSVKLNRFLKNSLEDSLVNLQLNILKIPPRLRYVAKLLCETLTSAKQAINDLHI